MSTATATKERPILFSGDMVRAILEGRKTQTRRIVKRFDKEWQPGIFPTVVRNNIRVLPDWAVDDLKSRCPYGQPGEHLWVRETWSAPKGIDDLSPKQMGERALDANYRRPWAPVRYWADMERRDWDESVWGKEDGKTRVSIHMPRWAARLTLEITGVRVERLNDISEEDALAEGIEKIGCWFTFNGGLHESRSARDSFSALWEKINGFGTWSDNPWLWVIDFRPV